MKRLVLLLSVECLVLSVSAQNTLNKVDSLRLEQLQEVVVKGVRAQKDAPFAIANIKKKELDAFSKTGRELPFLFSQTPGILAWSENGVGTGTTYMRIRGAGDSRINVTLDGVPLNSPEDQCVFWANMNSYGSLLGSVQIQRGVGTSTNGDGVFGGTVALTSKAPTEQAWGELSASYGSYNTYNLGGAFSTGLLGRHWIFDGAYHETNTDGFIHGTGGRSGSYYGGLSYVGDKIAVRYKNFGNFEKTGQAWNGVTAGDNDLSIMDGTYGAKTGIKTYKDLYDAGFGQYNTLYETMAYGDDGNPAKDDNGKYVANRYQMSDGSYWNKTTDNFWQSHNILSAAWTINSRWNTSASLHYTHGYGYYNEFRFNNKLKKFGLSNYTAPDGTTVKKSDFVRKKGLKQDTYGVVWNANYKDSHLDIIGGFALQQFSGNHFGYLTYVSNAALGNYLLGNGDYQYYDSDAKKLDGNAYLKAAYYFDEHWNMFAEVQYRHVGYKTDGYNDKFIDNKDGTYGKHYLDIDKKYDFFNGKVGFSYRFGQHRVYGSIAQAHREPERNNFTDNGNYPTPKAEQLLDNELGYQFDNSSFRASVNFYYMTYKDQFVQTGALSDIGEKLTTNIDKSYRMGVELTAGWDIAPWLTIEGNAALSKNKVKDFTEYVEDWDDWQGNPDAAKYHCDGNGDELREFHYDNSTLAFSPSVILNGFVNLHYQGWQAVWHTNYVSRQYLDNTENADRSLPCYSVSNLNLSYTSKVKKALGIKEVTVGMNFNNVFNRHYAASGWVYSAIAESYGHANDNRYYQIGFIPMAGFTTMGTLTLRF
ncbi:MAG: TonB-dependent receptor plug domain-containing protein [Prevotella sp.]|nr:TonB-dependent receptor plug domain-containing protein [Prevotella sp.]